MKRPGLILALLVVGAVALAFLAGPDGLSLDTTLWPLRARRVALALVCGAGLAAVGAALQAVFQNPLADPYVMGTSGGAALFGVVALAALPTGSEGAPTLAVAGASFLGAALATFFVASGFRDTPARGRMRPGERAILLGVVVNALCAAGITVFKTAVSAQSAQSMLFWLTGDIGYSPPLAIAAVAVVVAGGVALLFRNATALDVVALGDDEAHRLGIPAGPVRGRVLLVCAVIVGAIVPLCGLIGFVGLVVPHATRAFTGPRLRPLLLTSAAVGGALLAFCDGLARLSFWVLDTELPTGALTAVMGAPVFALVLLRRGRAA